MSLPGAGETEQTVSLISNSNLKNNNNEEETEEKQKETQLNLVEQIDDNDDYDDKHFVNKTNIEVSENILNNNFNTSENNEPVVDTQIEDTRPPHPILTYRWEDLRRAKQQVNRTYLFDAAIGFKL